MELFLDSTWSVSFKNKIICLDSAKNVRDKVAGETRQEYSMHDGCGLFCFVLFLVAKILEAWARKEMKNKDREMGLNLEFKFRIGIKRTNYLFIKYSKAILQVMGSFDLWLKLYRKFIESVSQMKWSITSTLYAQF